MARSEARISVDIWASESDFTTLSPGAQWMYFFLLSQPDLAHTGVIALRERRWSRAAAGMTAQTITAYLAELAAARYVVVDDGTEELLVRSFIRRDRVYRQPNVLRNAADQLPLIVSPRLRLALAVELERVAAEPMSEASAAILAQMREALPDPSPNPSENPSPNPSGNPARSGPGDVKGSRKGSDLTLRDSVIQDDGSGGSDITAVREGSGNPSGNPARSGPGERGVVTAVSNGFPDPQSPIPNPRTVPPPADREIATRDEDSQTLIGEWIDHCAKRPPGTVIGQVGKQIKAMLAEGIDPADIRRGLAAWHGKSLHPSTLPSVVNEVMNGARASPATRPSTTDARVAQALAAGAAVQAELDRQKGITDASR